MQPEPTLPQPSPIKSISICQKAVDCVGQCSECQVRVIGICGALDDIQLAELQQQAEDVSLPARGMLFMQGDAASHVYTVTGGCMRLSKDLADGRRQVVGFALPGDFLGLSLASKFGFSADALDKAALCRFTRADFTAFVETHPDMMTRLHQFAAHELTIAQEQMVLLGRRRAEERVAAFLLDWRERLHKLTGAANTLVLPMTRQDIADYLGLTIETVSRSFSHFARQKLIVIVPDGVRLLDIPALKAMVA
jgi:CRP/FNR family transcriptional regulator, anaerobic regulatory protein